MESSFIRNPYVDGELLLLADKAPSLVVEDNVLWREEFLQCPPTGMPVRVAEGLTGGGRPTEFAAGGGGG